MKSFKVIKKNLNNNIVFYKALYKDKRTPKISKIFFWLALGYAALPIDIIPDFIPFIGFLDDIIIVPVLLFIAVKRVPIKVYQEHHSLIFKK